MEVPYVMLLFGALGSLILIIYTNIKQRTDTHAKKLEMHETRIQKIEDIYSIKIDMMISEMNQLRHDVNELKKYVHEKVHIDNNLIHQQMEIIKRMHHYLESKGELI
jgi:TolA-binding protein